MEECPPTTEMAFLGGHHDLLGLGTSGLPLLHLVGQLPYYDIPAQ